MRLSADATLLTLGGIPMVGNLKTGGVIGLTGEGAELCELLARRDVSPNEVSEGCLELVEHLRRGGYLDGSESPAREHLGSAYLHVTQRCNLSCLHCYSEDADRNNLADPSLDELRRAIALLAELGCQRLVVSGGEPFLRADLADIASAARDSGIPDVVVLTNGLLVSEKTVRPLSELVSCVAVAFDGPTASSPAYLRGAQNFDRLVSAVRAIGAAGIQPRILPTLHAKNLDDMPLYQRLADELGATLGFSLLTANQSDLGGLALGGEQLGELGRRMAEGGVIGSDPVDGGAAIGVRRFCGAGVRTLSVGADGTVYPCHMLHDHRLAMGNAFSDDASAVTGSKVAETLRGLDAGAFEGCASCGSRHLCGGGCRARAFMTTGSLTSRDPYCELSRSHYEALGEQLAKRFGAKGGEPDAV